MAGAFAQDPTLACVSGPVLAARLDTEQERAADTALAWNKGFLARRFSLEDPPPDSAIFPFSPGLFGIGANMAVRTEFARAAGGFDEALGPGTPTHGGEDGEFMIRLILAGHAVGLRARRTAVAPPPGRRRVDARAAARLRRRAVRAAHQDRAGQAGRAAPRCGGCPRPSRR